MEARLSLGDVGSASHATLERLSSAPGDFVSPDVSEPQQIEAEPSSCARAPNTADRSLKNSVSICLATLELRHHRGKGGQSGSSKPTLDPDRVQAGGVATWSCCNPTSSRQHREYGHCARSCRAIFRSAPRRGASADLSSWTSSMTSSRSSRSSIWRRAVPPVEARAPNRLLESAAAHAPRGPSSPSW